MLFRSTSAALDRALAGPHRSAANRDRDRYRHPKETLEFFGLREDMAVMEVWPGAGGWWTEILAPVLHDKGAYYAAQWDPDTDSKYVQEGLAAFRAKLTAQPALYDRVNVVALQAPAKLAPVPPASLDLARRRLALLRHRRGHPARRPRQPHAALPLPPPEIGRAHV